jgi:hypothetical protein
MFVVYPLELTGDEETERNLSEASELIRMIVLYECD